MRSILCVIVVAATACLVEAGGDSSDRQGGGVPARLVLRFPPDRTAEKPLRYALAFPIQVGPRTAGFMVMRMLEGSANYGYLDGSDVILLDALQAPSGDRVFPLSRNEMSGARLTLKSPMLGGFVPLGACRPDGTPHAHAGTGFGLAQAHRCRFRDGKFSWGDPERQDLYEVYQLAFDGKEFTSRLGGQWQQNGPDRLRLGGTDWTLLADGITNAIPDGEDLLLPAVASRRDGSGMATGIIRWARVKKAWQPVDFDVVESSAKPLPAGPNPRERVPWMEPTLARDGDNGLLFSVRRPDTLATKEGSASGFRLQLWRALKPKAWRQVLDVPATRHNSPVSINVGADGTAYFLSNPYDASLLPETDQTGRGREKLALWKLTPARTGLEQPIILLNCLATFGAPPGADRAPEKWMVDHANGVTVRLGDGQLHHLIAYRVCHSPRYRGSAATSRHSGCYIHELLGAGKSLPVWRFAE